jgi:hypothetical protein
MRKKTESKYVYEVSLNDSYSFYTVLPDRAIDAITDNDIDSRDNVIAQLKKYGIYDHHYASITRYNIDDIHLAYPELDNVESINRACEILNDMFGYDANYPDSPIFTYTFYTGV